MNSFPCSPVSQFRPGIWPNVNHVPPHHVGSQALSHNSRSQQHPPQPANFQGITNKKEENGKDSSLKKEYSCDACQKEFTSKETLNAHLGSHVQCNHGGCTFKASRKMLKLHWIQVHASGKMRIKLDTPEEIAKWREERKRKYPTLANVEKKKEEEAKRRASGQILKTKNFRYRRGQRRGRSFQRGGHNHFNNRGPQRRDQEDLNDRIQTENHTQDSVNTQEDGNQERISGINKKMENVGDPLSFVLADSGEEEESDTEAETKEELSAPASKSPVTIQEAELSNGVSAGVSALTSLCSAYASDSEDNEGQTEEVDNNCKTVCPPDEKDAKKPENRKDVERKPEMRKEDAQQTNCRPKRCHKRNRKANSKVKSKSVAIRKSTLLEKLLAPKIRHERNVILQCIRHIVKKNFFGVEETSLPPQDIINN